MGRPADFQNAPAFPTEATESPPSPAADDGVAGLGDPDRFPGRLRPTALGRGHGVPRSAWYNSYLA
ncbi:hypothetical protein SAMD00023353_0101820 [Rosellinia necatrix]|uniref:Uncharacterized protein n=1 Tax=Rosellinia necatrix TaxID=77044 RepID=A0A1S8A4S6_ROSNE|nr:hypothetical protein SAMD00023353_0101820 [Rosellinia necatrix]